MPFVSGSCLPLVILAPTDAADGEEEEEEDEFIAFERFAGGDAGQDEGEATAAAIPTVASRAVHTRAADGVVR